MAKQFLIKDSKPWKSRFFTIWGGQALSILGSQLVQFALIWHLTVKTGSATVLASASLVGILPGVMLGPFIGTLVDRLNRRWIMMFSDSIIAMVTVGLAILFTFNTVTELHIYMVMFIRSLASCFHGNAMNASTSLMVPVEKLTRIQGINQMLNGGLNIISAPLGAILFNILSIQGILAIDVITAMLAILPLLFIQIPQPERAWQGKMQSGNQPTILQDFKAGFRFVLSWPGLIIIGLISMGINFTIVPAFSLLPLMVKDYFSGSAIHLGLIESAMGIGIIVGGALLGIWGGFRRKIFTSMVGLFGMGAGALILALTPSSVFLLAVGGALLVGFMMPITDGPFLAVIQSTVQPDMQARVFSLLGSVGTAMVPIGLMVAGPVADLFGIQTWFILSGLICILMSIAGYFIPAVMNIEDSRNKADDLQTKIVL